LRDDDSLRGSLRGAWHACVEWLAHALSPGVQRSTLRVCVKGPLLSDRVLVRQEIPPGGNAPVPGKPCPALGFGGAQLDAASLETFMWGRPLLRQSQGTLSAVRSSEDRLPRVAHPCAFSAQGWEAMQ